VSPLWSERLQVGVWPHGITIRDAGAAPADAASQAYWQNPTDQEEGSWRTSIATLQHWVSNSAPQRGRLDIVVSDYFVRPVVLAWSPDLTKDEEWLALARARIDVTWGSTEPWEVRIDRLSFKSNCLACGIPQELWTKLLELQRPGLKVNSIQPNFTSAFNSLASAIGRGAALIVVSERNSATIGAVEGGSWRHVRTLPAAGDASEEIERLVERERLLLGLPPDVAVVYRRDTDVPNQSDLAAV